jgi:hypothetical protein
VIALSVWKELGDDQLEETLALAGGEYRERLKDRLVAAIRDVMDVRDVAELVFETYDYEDGYFFVAERALVEWTDGSSGRVELPNDSVAAGRMRDALTGIGTWYSIGRDALLRVDMRTGDVEVEG